MIGGGAQGPVCEPAAGVGTGSAIVPRGFCYGDIPLRIVFLFSAWLLSLGAMAAPGDVATLDRSIWPEQLSNPTLFDVASRAEILMFARVLLDRQLLAMLQANLFGAYRLTKRWTNRHWPSVWACARSTWRRSTMFASACGCVC